MGAGILSTRFKGYEAYTASTLARLSPLELKVFTVPKLSEGFFHLQIIVNNLTRSIFQNFNIPYFYFSSA
jgi:hypothetical protein